MESEYSYKIPGTPENLEFEKIGWECGWFYTPTIVDKAKRLICKHNYSDWQNNLMAKSRYIDLRYRSCEKCGKYQEEEIKMNEQIENNFMYHSPKEGQAEKYDQLRAKAKELAYLIDETCPYSREKSLATTKLEEAIMWANASIARN